MQLLGQEINTVFFDKDGTLIDFPSIWVPWVSDIHEHVTKNLSVGNPSFYELSKALGVNDEGQVNPKSPLAIGSLYDSQVIISFLLYERGMPWDLAMVHSKQSIDYANEKQNNSTSIRSIVGIKEFLVQLKENDVAVGVLTADDTEKAWVHLKKVKLDGYIDFVIGSDQVVNGKPYSDMAYLAKERYGAAFSKSMMIGDTNADMQLGKRAGMKLTVGLVTYSKNELNHLVDADFIIKSYEELLVNKKDR